ncbi:MAG: hypothetical protein WBG71_07740 [Leeuwenhoekiella sp.]
MPKAKILLNRLEKIPVKTKESRFPTIVFIHGNASSSQIWENQWNAKSLKELHIVAVDLIPAHLKHQNQKK